MSKIAAVMAVVLGLVLGVLISTVVSVVFGLVGGTVAFCIAQYAAPAAFIAEWTWSQHVAAAMLLVLYGNAFSAGKKIKER